MSQHSSFRLVGSEQMKLRGRAAGMRRVVGPRLHRGHSSLSNVYVIFPLAESAHAAITEAKTTVVFNINSHDQNAMPTSRRPPPGAPRCSTAPPPAPCAASPSAARPPSAAPSAPAAPSNRPGGHAGRCDRTPTMEERPRLQFKLRVEVLMLEIKDRNHKGR